MIGAILPRASKRNEESTALTVLSRPAPDPRPSSCVLTSAFILPWVLMAGLATGCGGTDPADESTPRQSSPPALQLIATIGCTNCDDERQITPTAVALIDNDRVAILDSWEPFVRIFDAAGNPEASFGNQGQGPGEFGVSGGSRPIPAAWVLGIDGAVAVIDIFPPMLEVFDSAGEFIEQRPLDVPPVPIDQAFNATSLAYYRRGFNPIARSEGPAVYRCVLDLRAAVNCSQVAGLEQFTSAPWEPGAQNADLRMVAIAATPTGDLVLADRRSYRIGAANAAGEIVTQTGRDIPRREKTAEEIELERQRMRGAPADAEIDPLHPHIEYNGLDIDGSGRIWVLTTRWTETESIFDVFAPDGEYLGEATANALLRRGSWAVAPFFMGDNRLASVVQLPDGSEQVWVWRIVAGRP